MTRYNNIILELKESFYESHYEYSWDCRRIWKHLTYAMFGILFTCGAALLNCKFSLKEESINCRKIRLWYDLK